MEPSGPKASSSRSQLSGCLTVVLLSATLLLGGGLGALLMRKPTPPPATKTVEVRSGASVVTAITDLARLETTQWHMEKVINIREKQSTLFGLVPAEDAILLVAAGDVVAGVDLARPDAIQVEVEGKRAQVTLPAPEIFSARLDNERTYVHTRKTDLLAKRSEKLESQARTAAESTLRDAALEAGILKRAERSADRAVRSLVGALGFQQVDIRFQGADPQVQAH